MNTEEKGDWAPQEGRRDACFGKWAIPQEAPPVVSPGNSDHTGTRQFRQLPLQAAFPEPRNLGALSPTSTPSTVPPACP